MKTFFRFVLLVGAIGAVGLETSRAQIFTGTNSPGQGTNYTFEVGAGVTNLSLGILNNSSTYSYLLLKKGGNPTDTDYDFIARLVGQNNSLNLEPPELVATNYGLRVSTPAASGRHAFAVVTTANIGGLRSGAYPVIKPLAFSTSGQLATNATGSWHYFEVDMPTNLPGWRIVLSSTNGGVPSLYVRRGSLPLSTAYDKVGLGQNLSTVVYAAGEAVAGTYFLGVYLPPSAQSGAVYQLSAEIGYLTDLAWDPGTAHEGTLVFTNTSQAGGNYFFRALPQNTAVGAWRLALKVFSGEANLYLRQSAFDPNPAAYTAFRSERVGSDGFVVHSSQFAAGQTWYACVVGSPGAQWTLLSGEAYVLRLGTLPAATDPIVGTNVDIGPEGWRFFHTTTTSDTLAWRLGLFDATNDLLLKRGTVPLSLSPSTYDRKQAGQMLVVPSYLVGGDPYFIGVPGAPGQRITLDSRQQAILDLPFLSTNTLSASNFGYVTYRVSVPVQQMAWFLAVTPWVGDANVCLRRDYVPNEWNNDAFSEVTGPTTDSLSLVPPTLSDGTFFVTVYTATNTATNFSYTLTSGNPSITPVGYVSTTTNDESGRVGWRYYQVSDIQAQLGSLGWELFLAAQPPGTEIALRRGGVPGRWNYRVNDTTTLNTKGYVDYSSLLGFLQRPGHQADIWYVGVYNPSNALSQFVLSLRDLTGTPLSFDGATSGTNVVNQSAGRFTYFRVEVPPTALGWDVRLTNVTSGSPRLIVRRDFLPDSLNTTAGWTPASATNWPNGAQWAATDDWTDLSRNPVGTLEDGRILACGMGNPLASGTYYVAVVNQSGDNAPMSYSISSCGIGTGYALPVRSLAFASESIILTNLAPRQAAYFQVVIPTNADSWKLRLATNLGEALLLVQKDVLPNVGAAGSSPYALGGGRWVQKPGQEEYTLLPPSTNSTLPAGTYYLAVVSEGQNPDRALGRIGTQTVSATLSSLGPLGITSLGTVGDTDLGTDGAWNSGEVQAYRFTVPPGVVAFEVWLDNRVNNPRMTLRPDLLFPQPSDRYGTDGGATAVWAQDKLIQVANPVAGQYTLLVQAAPVSTLYTNASGSLRVHRLVAEPIGFDGGSFTANGYHPPGTWRYYALTVPPTALGWDIRLTNVTSGDPRLVVRRDVAPDTLLTPWSPWVQRQWPSSNQWAANYDWTGYAYDADGTNRQGHILQMGMGNPLEPGNYIIGVSSGSTTGYGTNEMRYTLLSRGIGPGLSIPVTPLAFSNGQATITTLPPREVAYFSVEVPTNLTSWSLRLATNAGDGLLCVQKEALPSVAALGATPVAVTGGRKLQKVGPEHYSLLASAGQSNVPAGIYYLAVVSEGWSPGFPNAARLGTNNSSFTLQSLGTMPMVDFGNVLPGADVSWPDTLEGGAVKRYQFTVMPGTMSLEVRLDGRVANPRMSLRSDAQIAMPAGTYGYDGGQPRTWQLDSQIVVANPGTGLYTLVVQADYTGPGTANLSVYGNAAYTVTVHAAGSLPLSFDGDAVTVTDHQPNTWRYYLVTNIPPTALGWDVRLTNVTSGDPRLVIRRDQPPSTLQSTATPWTLAKWPSNAQWAANLDWTGYPSDADGTNQAGHVLAMGMGNPLEPGTYYIGVLNGSTTGSGANVMRYTLVSRGIGPGLSIPVTPLPLTNGVAQVTNLPPREAAYFSLVIPSNMPSWQVRLGTNLGDALLCLQKDALPNVAAGTGLPQTLSGGRKVQKPGHEQYLLLPTSGQSNLVAGTYYLAVVAEGSNPGKVNPSWLGTNPVSATLQSIGPAPLVDLGWITAGSDLVITGAVEGGSAKIYQYMVSPDTLSAEAWLLNRVGNPRMAARADAQIPLLPGTYGNDGGQSRLAQQDTIVVPGPTNIFFTLVIQADVTGPGTGSLAVYSNATYTLWLRALGSIPMVFDGGVVTINDHMPNTWRYYLVDNVPAHAVGWDIRLTNVLGGDPRLVLRREAQPDTQTSHTSSGAAWSPGLATNWPAGYQWAASTDWTGYTYDVGGTSQVGRILQMGMGNPLEPGSYYIGVYNNSTTNIGRYTLSLRGIGDGYALPVQPLEYSGDRAPDGLLAAREAAHFCVDVPSNAPSWKVRLGLAAGDAVLLVQKSCLPNVLGSITPPLQLGGGYRLAKAGSEHFVLLPPSGQNVIPAGRYYLLIASQGLFPDPATSRAGDAACTYALSSQGPLPVEDLGPLPPEGVARPGALEGGELRAYRFSLPAGLGGLVARLENRTGNPWFTLRRGDALPLPYYNYGYNGGAAYDWQSDRSVTLANAATTNYALVVQASLSGSAFPSADYLLRLKPPPVVALAFDPLLEAWATNGLASACGVLADGERTFYRVEVPETLPDGTAVVGWRLMLANSFGQSSVRVRKDLLPADEYSGVGQTPFVSQQAIIVPPVLTPGLWFVEVNATGSASFCLSSSAVRPVRPAWAMPADGQPITTPGLTAGPLFADTGVDTNGVARSGDGGTDLEQGYVHYYAVTVPRGNGGVLRMILEAISGNPDLYLRADAPPTFTHKADGRSGAIYDRSLTGTGTEYGNWVPINGRVETELSSGVHYLAVRASGTSNCRYRLRLSTGSVVDVALNASLTSQVMAAGDWRYYRFHLPTNAPLSWTVTFAQQVGDVVMYVRDTVPPGQATTVTDYCEWSRDGHNHGPYPTYDPPGSYTFNTPPLRPGNVYYVGFRALSDATFSLGSATNTTAINLSNFLAFYGGYVTNVLPAYGFQQFRIDVPLEASRWRHTSVANSGVRFHLDQGSVPTATSSDHWVFTGNSTLDRFLLDPAGWPWLPGQMYFLTVTNTTGAPLGYSYRLDGRHCGNDDSDGDTLLDCWELAYWPSTSAFGPLDDPDHDGNNNLTEFLDGTDPTDPTSMLARLSVATLGSGTATVEPLQPAYPWGTVVTLTALPAPRNLFVGWNGLGALGTNNPLVLTLTTNRALTALFDTDYGSPSSLRADYQFQNNLLSSVGIVPALAGLNAGAYFTNLTVEGRDRTVWRFPQGTGLVLQPATLVFPSNQYTVAVLFRFDTVANWRRLLDFKSGTTWNGLYDVAGTVRFFPATAGGAVCLSNDAWHQVVLTREVGGMVRVYCDGVERLSFNDFSSSHAVPSVANALRFFKDNGNEEAAGYVARIRLFGGPLTPAQVAALDRAPAASSEPFRLSAPLMDGLGRFHFTITGPSGSPCRVESSTTLNAWNTVTNLQAFPGTLDFTSPLPESNVRFFRVVAP